MWTKVNGCITHNVFVAPWATTLQLKAKEKLSCTSKLYSKNYTYISINIHNT